MTNNEKVTIQIIDENPVPSDNDNPKPKKQKRKRKLISMACYANRIQKSLAHSKSAIKNLLKSHLKSMQKENENSQALLQSMLDVQNIIIDTIKAQTEKIDKIEDTFFTLYHNIKRNQWLFANEPEEWWNDYLDLKAFYLKQNKIKPKAFHEK